MQTKHIALSGLMLSLTIVLSIAESFFPTFPFLPPGVKIGLSNIIIMYSIFFTKKSYAFFLAIFKSLFVFLTRGATACLLSFGGGIFSILIIIFFIFVFKEKISYITLSILGAVFHNLGQIIILGIITNNKYIFGYFPILIISGIIMGTITGILLKTIMPVFKKVFNTVQKN